MERILKAAREKQRLNYKGTPIRLSAAFSAGQKRVETYIQRFKGKFCCLEYSTQQGFHLK